MRVLHFLIAAVIVASVWTRADEALNRIKPQPGRFKALTEPPCSYCSSENRKGFVKPGERVLAWIRGAHNGGAFPIRHFIAGQRVINDTYGLFFYDPNGGYVTAFKKDYGYEFYGWLDGVMVAKGPDGTLWSALSGQALAGPQKGKRLERVANLSTDWGYWLMLHPESTAYNLFDGGKYAPVELPSEMEAFAQEAAAKAGGPIPGAAEVLGVELNGAAVAFPLTSGVERACFNAEVGGEAVTVFWYAPTRTAAAFKSKRNGETMSFYADDISPETAPFKDKESGTRWTVAGRGVDGPRRGQELEWAPSVQCRWYAWKTSFPETKIFTSPKRD